MRIAQYEVSTTLGEGGMGRVYRARDPRLNRDVAIKLLHSDALASPDRRARFAAEARAASALNHPNIVTVYDVGEADGQPFIVSEYIDGETLRITIARGPIPIRRVLEIAVQIAAALAVAHGAGITHRDLKPDNIMLTKDGRIKLLDFGIAKLAASTAAPMQPDDATLTKGPSTEPGIVMGTVSYMSPEQVQGHRVEYYSDQFSFGLVLYELVSGKQAFARSSRPETMAAIIREEPSPLEPAVPAPLRWIVERLLAKDPQERYASTADLYRELRTLREHLPESSSTSTPVHPPALKRRWTRLSIPVLAALVGFALALSIGSPPQLNPGELRYTPIAREEIPEQMASWSPDGRSVAYSATLHGVNQVFVKEFGAALPAQLTHSTDHCRLPFWAPDGAAIFWLSQTGLSSITASGGQPSLVIPKATAAAVHPDGKTFVFLRDNKLWSGTRDIATQHELTQTVLPPSFYTFTMAFSPDGSRIAIGQISSDQGPALVLMSWPSAQLRRVPINSAKGFGIGFFTWHPNGRRIFVTLNRAETSLLIDLDADTGASRTIQSIPLLSNGPSLSADGKRLLLGLGTAEENIYELSVRDMRVRPVVARGSTNRYPDWSPSGSHFLFLTIYRGYTEIEDRPVLGGSSRVLASSVSGAFPKGSGIQSGRWAPDGERIAIVARVNGKYGLWLMNVTAGHPAALNTAADNIYGAPAWAPDGQWIAYTRLQDGRTQVVKVRPDPAADPIPLADAEGPPHWSPRGDWILFRGPSQNLMIVSPDGHSRRTLSSRTQWVYGFSREGSYVYAIVQNTSLPLPQWQLLSIEVATGRERVLGAVDLPESVSFVRDFSLHPDGQRFLFTVTKFSHDIWMLEGFDQPKSWFHSLLRR